MLSHPLSCWVPTSVLGGHGPDSARSLGLAAQLPLLQGTACAPFLLCLPFSFQDTWLFSKPNDETLQCVCLSLSFVIFLDREKGLCPAFPAWLWGSAGVRWAEAGPAWQEEAHA